VTGYQNTKSKWKDFAGDHKDLGKHGKYERDGTHLGRHCSSSSWAQAAMMVSACGWPNVITDVRAVELTC